MTDRGNRHSKDILVPGDRPGSADSPPASRRPDFALVIGIDHYPHFRPLKGAVNDAQRFHDWLIRPDGGGVDKDNVRFVPSKEDPLSPLKDQVDKALESLVLAARAAGGGGRLYFHFSGHGAEIDVHDVALLLAQWSLALGGPALSSELYAKHLIRISVFHEIVVLLDCCRQTAKAVRGSGPGFELHRDHRNATACFIAYATESRGFAYETLEADGEWHGVFTRCLLDILNGYPGISAYNLKRVLIGKLNAAGQRPRIVSELPDDSPFGLHGPLPILEIRFDEPIGHVQLIEYRDGLPFVAGEYDVTEGDRVWRQRLANGIYKLVAGNGREKLIAHEATVDLANGTEEVVTRETF